jgi:hypothetical protein
MMRRIAVLLTVVAMMVVMLAMSVAPAFAAPSSNACPGASNQGGTLATQKTGGVLGQDTSAGATEFGQLIGENTAAFSSQCSQNN